MIPTQNDTNFTQVSQSTQIQQQAPKQQLPSAGSSGQSQPQLQLGLPQSHSAMQMHNHETSVDMQFNQTSIAAANPAGLESSSKQLFRNDGGVSNPSQLSQIGGSFLINDHMNRIVDEGQAGVPGGLSSSNGGVGSLLQHIEQSEKSQTGETEQDIFLDFVNSNPQNQVVGGGQQPVSSLFLQQPQHNMQSGQPPSSTFNPNDFSSGHWPPQQQNMPFPNVNQYQVAQQAATTLQQM